MAIFQDKPGMTVLECHLSGFYWTKDGGGGDLVKSSPSTTKTQLFTGRMPFLLPKQQCQHLRQTFKNRVLAKTLHFKKLP